jgi:hypothetical protein
LAGTHAVPALHALHSPALQTRPVPQGFPLAAAPLSTHTGWPVLHVVWPSRQGALAMSQAVPTVQSVQVPTWQTLLVPQDAPSSSAVTASVHVGVPPAHESVPLWQAFVGTQLEPLLQA